MSPPFFKEATSALDLRRGAFDNGRIDVINFAPSVFDASAPLARRPRVRAAKITVLPPIDWRKRQFVVVDIILWQLCQFSPKPAMLGFVTSFMSSFSEKAASRISFLSDVSDPLTSRVPGIALLSSSASSFRSHQMSHCASGSVSTILRAALHLLDRLFRLASLRSESVEAIGASLLTSTYLILSSGKS